MLIIRVVVAVVVVVFVVVVGLCSVVFGLYLLSLSLRKRKAYGFCFKVKHRSHSLLSAASVGVCALGSAR